MKKTARMPLVEERKRRGWSQQELADHLGTTRHNVSRWEAGFTTPGPYFRAKLCELFGKSAQELGLLEMNSSLSREGESEVVANISAPPANTPALWTVPYLRNPHFTGREELLEYLDRHFSTSRDNASAQPCSAALTQSQAIKGLGGIGKTQIAVEYAYRARERNRYTHILWVNATSEEAIMTSFAVLVDMLPAIAATRETNQHRLVAAIKRWLEHCQERWLLIFDNADDVVLLQPYLPHQGNGSLLFTTRAHAVGAYAASLAVETMGLAEGTMLLLHRAQRQHASDEERNEAINIVIALDGFPLALDQAGAYIEETGCSFRDYLQTYQQHRQALLSRRGKQVTGYPDSVATTWSLSFERIEQTSPAAAELLHLCAFLAPDTIPEELLTEGAPYWPPLLQQAAADPFLFNQMIEELLKFSLVKRLVSDHLLSIHRLVQVVVVDTMKLEEQRFWVKSVIQATNEVFPQQVTLTTWSHCQRYLSQVQQCVLWIGEYACIIEEAASLLFRTARYVFEHALYSQAELLFEQARNIWEQVLGPEHPDVAAALYRLAGVSLQQARYAQAELFHQQALQIRERVLGAEHPDVAASFYQLGEVYLQQGNYEQAEPLFQRALQIWEQQQDPAYLDIAGVLDGLAIVYAQQRNYEQAEPLFQRALQFRKQVLGSHHPDIASSLNNLATFFLEQGKDEQAESLGSQALNIWEQSLGLNHPYLAYPLDTLAELSAKQGKYAQSELLYQRALQIREQALGREHPNVAYSLNRLANFYRDQSKYEEAEPLYQRALHIREQHLGQKHAETAEALHDFAALQEAQCRYQEAMSLYQRALAIRTQILGETHPATVATQTRYLALLHTMSLTEEAVAIERASSREMSLEPQ